jgi:16S rRNA processing protein RimM
VKGETLAIGRLGAPKGVRGDLKVHSYSGESAHFRKLKEADLRGTDPATGAPRLLKLKVERIEGSGPSLTMAFAGYPTPESARALTGLDIVVPRAEAAPLKSNEWYVVDLVGLSLVVAGEKVAVVRSILDGGADPWLEALIPSAPAARGPKARPAKPAGERTALVPFRKEFVGKVDLEAGTIELLAPELLAPDSP